MAFGRSTMLAGLLILAGLLQTAVAVEHIVGGTNGQWTFDSSNKLYDDWAAGQTFRVGDTLKFNYDSSHDVVQMSPADTAACKTGGSQIQRWTNPDDLIELKTAGTQGFICSISTHCASGMKMTITVLAASTPGGTPPAGTTPPPPPPGAASSLESSSALVFGTLVAALAALSF